MSKLKSIAIGSAVFGTQMGLAQAKTVMMRDLGAYGIDPQIIATQFQRQAGIQIEISELLRVSSDDEGKNLRFETLDLISITVAIEHASGPLNKSF